MTSMILGPDDPAPPPRARDPIAMAGLTVKAVDQIGEAVAIEIEKAAQSLLKSADETAAQLHDLARSVRQRSQIEGERVAEFVNKSTNIIETVRLMQSALDGKRNGDDRP